MKQNQEVREFILRPPVTMHQQIKTRAEQSCRSMQMEMQYRLRQSLAADRGEEARP
jgi:Arc-like DNA binding domain